MKRTTCATVLAGRTSRKNSPCTRATRSQSSMRVSSMRVRTTSESRAPKLSSARATISKQRRACASASPGATVRPSASSGAVPATVTKFPARTAREMPMRGSKGEPLETRRRSGFDMALLSQPSSRASIVISALSRRETGQPAFALFAAASKAAPSASGTRAATSKWTLVMVNPASVFSSVTAAVVLISSARSPAPGLVEERAYALDDAVVRRAVRGDQPVAVENVGRVVDERLAPEVCHATAGLGEHGLGRARVPLLRLRRDMYVEVALALDQK